MKVNKIAFAAKAASGKDTAGYYLIEKYRYRLMRFSDPVYELHNMVVKHMGLPPGKYRELLQVIGTSVGRTYDTDIWIKKFNNYLNTLPKDAKVVVTDVRFPNEVKYLRSKGFLVFKVERDNKPEAGGIPNHESETALDNYEHFDGIIKNNGTIEDLHKTLETLLQLRGVKLQ